MTRLARCVMVQGTASGVGKSVIATALCRVLRDEGYRVAPFKAQNMSLNAAVTADGGEIGRAQFAQAEAAGAWPTVDMNPILLKPEGEMRSQLVVLGRATGTVSARDHWSRRRELWPVVAGALGRLRRAFDAVVIEGAGSPAELNLRGTDIVNMRVARAARAAVLLVGDIERGGVFAQLLGTLALLPERERSLVRGLVVNKFRGDPALFAPGVRLLERRSGLPVVGVLPYAEALGVPGEDSLGLGADAPRDGAVDVAVLRYPRISNFDDVEPLAAAGARVRYVSRTGALGDPDLVVLPGSKATVRDLEWLRASGLAARVRALADAGVPIVGICGGFQMLGEELRDPDGVEGHPGSVRGLGLLPVRTLFRRAKRTVPVRGRVIGRCFAELDGVELEGYELHVGDTRGSGAPFAEIAPARVAGDGAAARDGAVSADGRVVGTYVHGLFASAPLRDRLLRALARRRGVAFAPAALPEDRYAAVGEWLRSAVDVPRLFAVLGLDDAGSSPR